jgi:hypothetical protein
MGLAKTVEVVPSIKVKICYGPTASNGLRLKINAPRSNNVASAIRPTEHGTDFFWSHCWYGADQTPARSLGVYKPARCADANPVRAPRSPVLAEVGHEHDLEICDMRGSGKTALTPLTIRQSISSKATKSPPRSSAGRPAATHIRPTPSPRRARSCLLRLEGGAFRRLLRLRRRHPGDAFPDGRLPVSRQQRSHRAV